MMRLHLTAALVLLGLPGLAGATLHPRASQPSAEPPHVSASVRGSGRLVKQVPAAKAGMHGAKAGKRRQARLAVTVPALLARSRPAGWAAGSSLTAPPIVMEHLTSHATHQLRPDQKGGGFSPRQMGVLANLLRCHHTGMRRPIAERLVSLLYQTARHFNNAKVYVVAGFRAPSVAKQKGNPKSPHKRGVACDFRLEGVALSTLRDYLMRAYRHVGVGYYPNANFVHLDVGRQQDASWIDLSAPGERARYAAPSDLTWQEQQGGLAQAGPAPSEGTWPAPPKDQSDKD